jgi:lysophospholipase L1-like esterase
MRVIVFGDSIAYGAWDSQAGWVERLKKRAHTKTIDSNGEEKFQVINLGIGGDTSRKILSRMKSEITARHSPSWPLFTILAFGTNDARSIDGVAEVSLEEYEQNTQQIFSIAKEYSDSVLVLGMPPVGKSEVLFKGQTYTDSHVQEYDSLLRRVCEQSRLSYVSTRDAFEARGLDGLYTYDFLHPNDAGHGLIEETVYAQLVKMGVQL